MNAILTSTLVEVTMIGYATLPCGPRYIALLPTQCTLTAMCSFSLLGYGNHGTPAAQLSRKPICFTFFPASYEMCCEISIH